MFYALFLLCIGAIKTFFQSKRANDRPPLSNGLFLLSTQFLPGSSRSFVQTVIQIVPSSVLRLEFRRAPVQPD